MDIIHINQRRIRYKNIKQNACLVQTIDEYNLLEDELLKNDFNYKRYEHDYDFFKSSSKNARCNYIDHSLKVIETLNSNDISYKFVRMDEIIVPYLTHTKYLPYPKFEKIPNKKFLLLLVHIIDDETFDYDTINFYDETDRDDIFNNYNIYPSDKIVNILKD